MNEEVKELLDKLGSMEDAPLIWINQRVENLITENKQLKQDIEELNLIVGIRQKRNLISKFDKEYDEEDKKKKPNRDYAGIIPDAEEVYKRYYKLKDRINKSIEYVNNHIHQETFTGYMDSYELKKLLSLLKGDKE